MELFQIARKRAGENVRMADHLLHVTYASLGDPKLLLSVVHHLHNAWEEGIIALVEHERLFKRIQPFQDTAENRLRIFSEKLANRHGINISSLKELVEIEQLHKNSPIEFRKKDRFVICSDRYSIKTIHAKELKEHYRMTIEFLKKIQNITAKHERIFRRS